MVSKKINKDNWLYVGEIAYRALKYVKSMIKPGVKLIDICETAEEYIRRKGAKPAFPVNISVNNIAAHYTSPPQDKTVIPDKAVVKIDLGALLQTGEISDVAITVGVNIRNKVNDFIKATREVLYEAIDVIRDGVRVGDIGRVIWQEAHKRGYGVLVDLGGHSISLWKLHAGITIPNVFRRYSPKLKEGMIVAIEPFLVFSKDDSHTRPDYSNIHIFSIRAKTLNEIKKERILKILYAKFKNMPFALRWLRIARRDEKVYLRLQRLLIDKFYENKVNMYPTLVDVSNNLVAQYEHTILVKRNSALILTGDSI